MILDLPPEVQAHLLAMFSDGLLKLSSCNRHLRLLFKDTVRTAVNNELVVFRNWICEHYAKRYYDPSTERPVVPACTPLWVLRLYTLWFGPPWEDLIWDCIVGGPRHCRMLESNECDPYLAFRNEHDRILLKPPKLPLYHVPWDRFPYWGIPGHPGMVSPWTIALFAQLHSTATTGWFLYRTVVLETHLYGTSKTLPWFLLVCTAMGQNQLDILGPVLGLCFLEKMVLGLCFLEKRVLRHLGFHDKETLLLAQQKLAWYFDTVVWTITKEHAGSDDETTVRALLNKLDATNTTLRHEGRIGFCWKFLQK